MYFKVLYIDLAPLMNVSKFLKLAYLAPWKFSILYVNFIWIISVLIV